MPDMKMKSRSSTENFVILVTTNIRSWQIRIVNHGNRRSKGKSFLVFFILFRFITKKST